MSANLISILVGIIISFKYGYATTSYSHFELTIVYCVAVIMMKILFIKVERK